jgi:mannose-6-phosphate isomerase-like protein (cupin superfamily)
MTEQRPWGYYKILEDAETHKVKRICVNPNQRLSLQSHAKREELWVVIKGKGRVILGDRELLVIPGSVIHIPFGTKHRVTNDGTENLEFIEVQMGTYFGEDDIVRYSDDYGRA